MAHLGKGASGHLLKNPDSGHLANNCDIPSCYQARRCYTDALVELYLHITDIPQFPLYALRAQDQLCYYFLEADATETCTPEFGPFVEYPDCPTCEENDDALCYEMDPCTPAGISGLVVCGVFPPERPLTLLRTADSLCYTLGDETAGPDTFGDFSVVEGCGSCDNPPTEECPDCIGGPEDDAIADEIPDTIWPECFNNVPCDGGIAAATAFWGVPANPLRLDRPVSGTGCTYVNHNKQRCDPDASGATFAAEMQIGFHTVPGSYCYWQFSVGIIRFGGAWGGIVARYRKYDDIRTPIGRYFLHEVDESQADAVCQTGWPPHIDVA